MSTKAEREFEAVNKAMRSLPKHREWLKEFKTMSFASQIASEVATMGLLSETLNSKPVTAERIVEFLGGVEALSSEIRDLTGLDRNLILQANTSRLVKKYPSLKKAVYK